MGIDDGNGRVSMARLDTKLDYLIKRLDDHIKDDENDHADFEVRIRSLHQNQTVIKERQNVLTGVNGFISLLFSSISAYIGRLP